MDLCGIDEAGRGCIAGPLVVCGVVLLSDVNGLDDSKKLTSYKREALYEVILSNSIHEIVFVDNRFIDKNGLSVAIGTALKKIVSKIDANRYIFDGNCKFGVDILDTIIKADTKIKEVSAASILAKVSRDRFMVNIDKRFCEYGFKKHKGYPTKEHILNVKRYGYCDIHRKSFNISF